jgi:hypothetical protein
MQRIIKPRFSLSGIISLISESDAKYNARADGNRKVRGLLSYHKAPAEEANHHPPS